MTDYNSYNKQQYSGPPQGNYQTPNSYQNNTGSPQNYGYSQENMQKNGDNYYNLEFERSDQLKEQ